MAGPASAGLGASRWAGGSSGVNPLGGAQGRQAGIKARIDELKRKSNEEAAKAEKARRDADTLESELAAEFAAEQAREEAEKHAAEALRRENERPANEKKAAEAKRILNEKMLAAEAASREAEKQKQAAAAIDAKNKQEIQRLNDQLMELERDENEKLRIRTKAASAVQEALTSANARVKEVSNDKSELSKLMDETKTELATVQERLDNMTMKSTTLDDQLLGAKKEVQQLTTNADKIKSAGQKERAVFEKLRDELIKRLDQLKTSQSAPTCSSPEKSKLFMIPESKSSAIPIKKPTAETSSSTAASTTDRANVVTEGQVKFPHWPLTKGDRDPSKVRSVKLSGFPTTAGYRDVVSVVWAGNVQQINYSPGSNTAEIQFLKAEDCSTYFKSTVNGIKYPADPQRFIHVEQCSPEPSYDKVKKYIEHGITRCVRLMDVDSEWSKKALQKLAMGATGNRGVERIVNGQNAQGRRIVDFRFLKITDAAAFKGQLDRSHDWEATVIKHCEDPCAKHTSAHTGLV